MALDLSTISVMRLFSKRYDVAQFRRYGVVRRGDSSDLPLFSNSLINRLLQQIKFATSKPDFLERFLLVYDENALEFYINNGSLRDLSLTELGYDLTTFFDCRKNLFTTSQPEDQIKFFDLVELLIIFCKSEKRSAFVERLREIFREEGGEFDLHRFMIIKRGDSGLRAISPMVKDTRLQDKIKEYGELRHMSSNTYAASARVSADVLQFIFSHPTKKGKTKDTADEICKKMAEQLTDSKNSKTLGDLLNDTVKLAREWNNQISNIRHADQHTIPVGHPDIYKMISTQNNAIAELVLLSLPERFITDEDPDVLRESYIKNFAINRDTKWTIKEEIRVEDIPF